MAKVKLTKGNLKRQRDALRQYERYLPTLQLKKQQLQREILSQRSVLEERQRREEARRQELLGWSGLLKTADIDIKPWIIPESVSKDVKNIAGIDLPVFQKAGYNEEDYDLFETPQWLDKAIDGLRALVSLREEIKVLREGLAILQRELRTTSQRVNLFEKVKIPEAREAIRKIKIYLGDQMTNAVGRSKIAQKKIEEAMLQEVAA